MNFNGYPRITSITEDTVGSPSISDSSLTCKGHGDPEVLKCVRPIACWGGALALANVLEIEQRGQVVTWNIHESKGQYLIYNSNLITSTKPLHGHRQEVPECL